MKIVKSFDELLDESITYAVNNELRNIILFSKSKDGVDKIIKLLDENNLNIVPIIVTFPMNQEYLLRNEDGEIEVMEIELHEDEVREEYKEKGIIIISSMMPFDDIITRSSDLNKHSLIEESLSVIHPALPLSIQSVLIATDTGVIKPGENVVSIVNGISISTNATNSRYLFHPEKGMEVNEIISKIKED